MHRRSVACRTSPKPAKVATRPKHPADLIYHRYRIGDDGLIAEAKIVPPTSQNQGQIEDDLRAYVPQVRQLGRCRSNAALRTPDSQLRSVHQLRDAFPQVETRSGRSLRLGGRCMKLLSSSLRCGKSSR